MLSAFVGHSFNEEDEPIIRKFCKYLDTLADSIGLQWESAEQAEPKVLAQKVKEKMANKDIFIGICTKKEIVLDPKVVYSLLPWFSVVKANKKNLTWKTSDWILQEAAYAIGQGKSIILLIEKGVRNPEPFQTNHEYIIFERNNIAADVLNKLTQMLISLRQKSNTKDVFKSDFIRNEESDDLQKKVDDLKKNNEEDSKGDYFTLLINAVFNKDLEQINKVVEDHDQESNKSQEEKIDFRATALHLRFLKNGDNVLDELLDLSKNNNSSNIDAAIANIYDSYNEAELAIRFMEKAISSTLDDQLKFKRECDLVILLNKYSKPHLKDKILELSRQKNLDTNKMISLLGSLVEVYKKDDPILSSSFLELIISIKPDDFDKRFALAMQFSKINEKELALYHYNILATIGRKNGPVYNNLGVAQSNLGLSIRSVKSFRNAEKQQELYAMKNLAMQFATSGFVEEAILLAENALAIKKDSEQIYPIFGEIDKLENNERNREEGIIKKANQKKLFYINIANGFLSNKKVNIDGIWESSGEELNVKIENDKFEAVGFSKLANRIYTGLFERFADSANFPVKDMRNLKYEGRVFGCIVRYKRYVFEDCNSNSLFNDFTEGILTFDEDKIEMYEIDSGISKNSVFKRKAIREIK